MPDTNPPKSQNLLETSIITNSKDIREVRTELSGVKEQITDLRLKQQDTESTLRQLNNTTGDVKSTVNQLDGKLDQVNESIKDNQIKGLEEYKNLIWKVALALVTAGSLGAIGLMMTQ